jgi:predicted alpha/beta hydrolase family esterase
MNVLLLPGWQNSGPAHWQSRWEALHGFHRVQQAEWENPVRAEWITRLEEVLQAETNPVVLVAHSLGCQLVAAWAAQSAPGARVQGALLVAPPDTERPGMPAAVARWGSIARQRLPFPSLVLFSDDDPFCSATRAQGMAVDWGARAVSLGAVGHFNSASGLGDWPEGLAWLDGLSVGEVS